jgi:hypothetical protein
MIIIHALAFTIPISQEVLWRPLGIMCTERKREFYILFDSFIIASSTLLPLECSVYSLPSQSQAVSTSDVIELELASVGLVDENVAVP